MADHAFESCILRFGQFDIEPAFADEALRASSEIAAVLQSDPTFCSLSLWFDLNEEGRLTLVVEATDDKWLPLIEEFLEPFGGEVTTPLSTWSLHSVTRRGATFEKLAADAVMSTSFRTAEPGHARDLISEYRLIFESLEVLPGFLGSQIGQNPDLEEEIGGLVFWTDRDAFKKSLPNQTMYEVRVYELARLYLPVAGNTPGTPAV